MLANRNQERPNGKPAPVFGYSKSKNVVIMKKVLITAAFIGLLFSSCTDATSAKLSGYGNKYKVEILSGGQVVRTYISTGKVQSEEKSDGYYFMDAATNKLVEISGDIIITQLD
jgi:hypothetical protein